MRSGIETNEDIHLHIDEEQPVTSQRGSISEHTMADVWVHLTHLRIMQSIQCPVARTELRPRMRRGEKRRRRGEEGPRRGEGAEGLGARQRKKDEKEDHSVSVQACSRSF